MYPEVLYDRLNNLVVLFFGSSKVWPREVLQLGHNPPIHDHSIGVFLCQLESAFYQVRHQRLHRYQQHLLITLEWNPLHALVLPDLRRPVLVTLDLRVLLEVCEHYYQGHALLVDHAPKVLNSRLKGSLSSNKQLVISSDGRVDEVRINVGIIDVFIPLYEANASMFNYYDYKVKG